MTAVVTGDALRLGECLCARIAGFGQIVVSAGDDREGRFNSRLLLHIGLPISAALDTFTLCSLKPPLSMPTPVENRAFPQGILCSTVPSMNWRAVLGLRILGLRYEPPFIVLELDNGLELLVSADWEGAQVLVNEQPKAPSTVSPSESI